jgi:hypothetical protein
MVVSPWRWLCSSRCSASVAGNTALKVGCHTRDERTGEPVATTAGCCCRTAYLSSITKHRIVEDRFSVKKNPGVINASKAPRSLNHASRNHRKRQIADLSTIILDLGQVQMAHDKVIVQIERRCPRTGYIL